MDVSRRTLLATGCAVVVGTAGCTDSPVDADGGPTGTETARDLPEDCPTSQDLGVEWPAELDAAATESFVEAYENVYYREVGVDYEPESRVDEYGLEAIADRYGDDRYGRDDEWAEDLPDLGENA